MSLKQNDEYDENIVGRITEEVIRMAKKIGKIMDKLDNAKKLEIIKEVNKRLSEK